MAYFFRFWITVTLRPKCKLWLQHFCSWHIKISQTTKLLSAALCYLNLLYIILHAAGYLKLYMVIGTKTYLCKGSFKSNKRRNLGNGIHPLTTPRRGLSWNTFLTWKPVFVVFKIIIQMFQSFGFKTTNIFRLLFQKPNILDF